jgi:hypothetical protein
MTDVLTAGVSQEEKMIDWLHDSWFSAVAGDAPSFEAWPSQESRCANSCLQFDTNAILGWYLHEYLLPLWGNPIGEMFDLEKLAKTCRANNRWTFFVTSQPANVPGE